jgi:hypothetical protein
MERATAWERRTSKAAQPADAFEREFQRVKEWTAKQAALADAADKAKVGDEENLWALLQGGDKAKVGDEDNLWALLQGVGVGLGLGLRGCQLSSVQKVVSNRASNSDRMESLLLGGGSGGEVLRAHVEPAVVPRAHLHDGARNGARSHCAPRAQRAALRCAVAATRASAAA